MKKISLLVVITLLVSLMTQPVHGFGIMPIGEETGEEGYKLIVNGETLVFDGYTPEPVMNGEFTMVPLRSVMENLGFVVSWNGETKSVEVTKGDLTAGLQLGNAEYTLNGEAVALGIAHELVELRTFIPTEFLADIIGVNVILDGMTIHVEGQTDFVVLPEDETIIPIVADVPLDYDVDNFYEYVHEITDSPIEGEGTAILIEGNNHSDDMFMGFAKKLTGLNPETSYIFKVSFDLGTNVPGGMMGIGGSPGSSVYVKAGVSANEPAIAVEDEYYRFDDFDKGNQASNGTDMRSIDNIEKSADSYDESYQYKTMVAYFICVTDENGEAYLVLGTDSGFEGLTSVYYDNITVTVREGDEYNLSTVKESSMEIEYYTRVLEDETYISVPHVTGLIQYDKEVALNELLTAAVDEAVEGKKIGSFFFSSYIINNNVLSLVFNGREVVGEEQLAFYKVITLNLQDLTAIETSDWIKAGMADVLAETVNTIAIDKGIEGFEFNLDMSFFYEEGFYGIVYELDGLEKMLIINEADIAEYMNY